jgi:hypothetical protein
MRIRAGLSAHGRSGFPRRLDVDDPRPGRGHGVGSRVADDPPLDPICTTCTPATGHCEHTDFKGDHN